MAILFIDKAFIKNPGVHLYRNKVVVQDGGIVDAYSYNRPEAGAGKPKYLPLPGFTT